MTKIMIALFLAAPSHAAPDGKLSRALQQRFQTRSQAPASPAAARPAFPTIILDPGHGGEDWGAVVKGRREKDITLAVARKLKERLERLGLARVLLTRVDDSFVQLDERVGQSVSAGGTIFVSLHANQVRQKTQSGIIVYAFGRDPHPSRHQRLHRRRLLPLPPPPLESARLSAALASGIVRFLRGDGFHVEPPARADYYVLKNPSLPSVLVEMGYLSNPKESALLGDAAYQDRLADSLARSLAASVGGTPGPTTAGR